MKKTLIISITLAAALVITGCSMAQIEKEPVIVADILNSPIEEKEATSENSEIEDQTAVDLHTDTKPEDTDSSASGEAASKNTPAVHNDEPAAVAEPIPSGEEKQKLTIKVEGMEEEINGELYHSDLGYQITYDKDRFKYARTSENVDSFTADNPDPELYPYVYINIRRIDTNSIDNTHSSELPPWALENEDFKDIHIARDQMEEVQLGSDAALYYQSTSGNEWNSPVNNYYVIEQGDSYYYIETQYFQEAAEGYGARINAMLETFQFE